MPVKIFPVFKTNKAFTVQALFRKCRKRLPNMNDLPETKNELKLIKAACLQLKYIVTVLLRDPEVYSTFAQHHNKLFIPTSVLFPQLPLISLKFLKQPALLSKVWGPYVEQVVTLLLKLPAKKVVFSLDADDEIGDDILLSLLAHHPRMQRHVFLLSRPTHAQYYAAQSVSHKKKSTKKAKSRRKSTKTTITEQFNTAILQVSYEQLRWLKVKDKRAKNIRQAIKVGSYLILN